MRCLDRDRRRVLLGAFLRTEPEERGGKLTGRNVPVYDEALEFWPTVAPVRGEAQGDYFGQRVDYDVTLTIDDPTFAVGEADVLWVDADEEEPHDYIVRKVARTGGFTVIAAKKVDVGE